jgi:cobalt-zinc-cadmium resistance protein CzcA
MFEKLIAFSLRQRALVLMGTLALVAGGLYAATRLPVDAVPDVTNNQVQVLTQAPALSPLEVERFVTFPVELALKTLPDVVELRSLSRQGISVVTVVFEEGVETYFARQLILEKLREAEEELPPGVETPELGPVSTGLGEIFRYTLHDTTGTYSPMELRTIQDWIVRRQLLGVPGLAEVNSIGGYLKQYQVLVDPDRLAAYGLTLREVFDAAAEASGSAGAAYIETGPEQLAVRTAGLVTGVEDLEAAVVHTSADGTPVLLRDVADVEIGPAIRFGAATQDGQGEVVTGFTMQLKGANARVVTTAVKDEIEEIQASLPDGVVIEPYYDRTALVDRTVATVARNLTEGALLVVVVLLLLLAHLRAGLIVASVIPLSMLFAVICMVLTGQTGNLMSLGAIDFGLVVDGSLIVVENVLRLIAKRQREGHPLTDDEGMRGLTYSGAVEVLKAAKFGVFIIIIVYLPIMALQGIEGKLFRPMALTVSFALLGSLILSVTYVPAMCSLFLKGDKPVKHSPIIEWLHKRYRPALARVMGRRRLVVGAAAGLFALSAVGFAGLGAEFVPRLDEGDLAVQIIRLPSVSLSESVEIAGEVERRLMAFPEVETVVGNTGRAEISTDPMGFEITDAYVILKPRDEWETGRTKEELVEAMAEAVEGVPAGVQFYQPIEMRTNELIAGARGDVVIKLFGEDYDVLTPLAEQIQAIVQSTEGAADVSMDQTTGSPQLVVRPDRAALARYGLTVEGLNRIVETAVGGAVAGQVYEGERRFDLVVRFAAESRRDPAAIQSLPVVTPTGARVPLSALATVEVTEGPASVSREEGSRFVGVSANVRGRDVASFVEDVQDRIAAEVDLPAGYFVDYGGAFENLQEASKRLALVIPIALLLIFLLLYQTFQSVRLGLIIYLCVPMAVIGGVAALYLAGLPFSISAAVGFIALFGIAVLNGIVMVAAFRKFEEEGLEREEAVLAGADERLRPVVTTATLALLGFVPMLLAHSAGAEVQRPLATVVIGGLVSSTLLTLFVLPTVYAWLGGRREGWRSPTESEVEAETFTPPEEAGLDAADSHHGPGFFDGARPAGDGETTRPSPRPNGGAALGLVLALLLGGGVARAQDLPPTGLTLADALTRAEAVAPELRLGTAAVTRAAARRASAGILEPTELFVGVDNAPAFTGSAGEGAEASLGVGQSARLPAYYRAQRGAAQALLEQVEVERGALRRGVRVRAALAYLDALAARERLALADSAVAVAATFARASARRQELGDANALEPLQAQVALAEAERERAEAAGRARAAEAALRTLLAFGPEDPLAFADALVLGPAPDSLAILEARLAEINPDLATAEAAVRVAEAERRAVRVERLPAFSGEVAFQRVGGSFGYVGARVGVAIPIARIANDAPDRAAEAAVAVAEAERDRLLTGLVVDLRGLFAALQAARAQALLYAGTLVPQAERAYALALALRREGAASYLEVLQAQTALIETRAAAVEARHEAARLRAELDALTTAF